MLTKEAKHRMKVLGRRRTIRIIDFLLENGPIEINDVTHITRYQHACKILIDLKNMGFVRKVNNCRPIMYIPNITKLKSLNNE